MKFILLKRQKREQAGRILFLAENANKGFGYLKNLIISWGLGFSSLSDLYFFIFSIASSISNILGGALGATLIPYTQRLGSRKKRQLIGVILIIFSLLYLGTASLSSTVMIYFSPNQKLRLLVQSPTGVLITSGVILTFLFLQSIQIADEYFKSRKNFLFGTLSYVFVSALTIIILYRYQSQKLWLIGWAPLFPAVLIFFGIYAWIGRAHIKSMQMIMPYLQKIWPLMISGSFGMLNVFVDRWFATSFPDGRLSTLQTASMLITQVGGVFINPIINSAYPFIAALYQKDNQKQAMTYTNTIEKRILFWLVAFSICYLFFGKEVIRIFYHHGSVSITDTYNIYSAGVVYLPVLIYSSLVSLHLRLMYCNDIVKLPATCSTIVIIINIFLTWVFSTWFGWQGLALATSLSAGLYYLILATFSHKMKIYHADRRHLIIIIAPLILAITQLI